MSLENLKSRLRDNDATAERPAKLPVRDIARFRVTAGELREAVAANPSHPVAKVYAKSTARMPDDYEIVVERPDLDALVTDQDVILYSEIERGRKVYRKRLVPPETPRLPSATPNEPNDEPPADSVSPMSVDDPTEETDG